MTILGFPKYRVTGGQIIFKGEDITELSTTERVRMGIGVSFQNPPVIRGVKLMDLLKVESGLTTEDELTPELIELARKMKFDKSFLERDVNLGFSGGEVKRSEILQLLAQKPDFIMFDEPDSGVDIENVELLAEEINVLLDKDKKPGLRRIRAPHNPPRIHTELRECRHRPCSWMVELHVQVTLMRSLKI